MRSYHRHQHTRRSRARVYELPKSYTDATTTLETYLFNPACLCISHCNLLFCLNGFTNGSTNGFIHQRIHQRIHSPTDPPTHCPPQA